jgi:hypothetical protein
MNPITRILSFLIVQINILIDKLDRKTIETIKQSFYFLIFIATIAAIILGYTLGKKAAKRGGKPLAELTNEAFTIDIKKERREGGFPSMLDTETIREVDRGDFNKLRFPSKEILEPETKDNIVEPESLKKRSSTLQEIDTDRIAEIDREGTDLTTPDVEKLKRREAQLRERNLDIIKDEEKRIMPPRDLESRDKAKDDKGTEKPNILKKQKRSQPRELKLLEKKQGIID